MYSHSRYNRTLDGRVCATQWTQSIGGQENFDLHWAVSDETGRRWSNPKPVGLPAQTSWCSDLGEGRLAIAYTVRDRECPGIYVTIAHEGSGAMEPGEPAVVWDAVGQEYLGAVRKPDYPASHDNIAFGKPNMVRLPDGDLLCAWWCTQSCVTHARFARLRVPS
jgi:hypothetical protein